MNAPSGFSIELDLARNLVRTRYSGIITEAEMRSAVKQVETALPQLSAGFSVLADWSALDKMDLACAQPLSEIMDLCGKHGVGLIVRVLPDSSKDIGINILSVVHYRGKVRTVTCETLAEAERALR